MAERELVAPEDVEFLVSRNRWFWLQLLKAGPNRDQDEATVERLQLAHLQHLFSLERDGLLTLFGPVDDASELRGIGVLLVETREEAEALMADDPMVKAGRLVAEVRPWFTRPGGSLPG
ncbi:MAG: YciI family protein [Chloroflexi bacterium]|nr:YciI family protein [Chloroflexota bacterium]